MLRAATKKAIGNTQLASELASALLEMSPTASGVVSAGVIVESNAAARQLGLACGLELWNTINESYKEHLAQALAQAQGTAVILTTSVVGLRASWIEWSFCLRDATLLFCARDVTAAHDTAGELDEYMERLRLRSEEMEQFAYAASHDIQEPIRTIINYAAFMFQDYGDLLPAEGLQNLEFITASANHARELVRALLEFSRVGKEPRFAQVPLMDVVRSVVSAREFAVRDAQATVMCEELPTVWGDAALLSSVFSNLISNALKFSKTKANIAIECSVNEDFYLFHVSDNGVGFEMRYAPQLFQMFRRLDNSKPGVGIGLATCRKAVQLHGGAIWTKSLPGIGSTFSFTLARNHHEAVVVGGGSLPRRQGDPASLAEPDDSPPRTPGSGWRGGAFVLAEEGRIHRDSGSRLDSIGPQPPEGDGLRRALDDQEATGHSAHPGDRNERL